MKGREKAPPQVLAALYIRVSTTEQSANGASLRTQEDRLRAHCKLRGWSVAGVYSDDASAKNMDRPALQKLLADMAAGKFGAVCATKLDRLTRSVKDLYGLLETFQERDVALVSTTEAIDATTATGKAMVGLIGVFAEWERDVIRGRVRDGIRGKRDRGEVYGPVPFGFRARGGKLAPHEREMEAVRLMRKLRERGKSLRAIAERLNRDGVRTRRSGKWAGRQVAYVLRNDIYGKYIKGR